MRTGLTKKQKTTMIYFDEHSRIIEVQTHNTDLKKRLTAFAAKYPQCCRQTDDDEQGGLTFEIEKGRLSFRLTAPYSEERRKAASKQAKQNGVHKIVDSRPSDAIAIAIRAKAPVFVDEDILDAVGIRPEDVLPQARHEEDSSDVDADLDIFEDFLGQLGKDDTNKDQPSDPSDEDPIP